MRVKEISIVSLQNLRGLIPFEIRKYFILPTIHKISFHSQFPFYFTYNA